MSAVKQEAGLGSGRVGTVWLLIYLGSALLSWAKLSMFTYSLLNKYSRGLLRESLLALKFVHPQPFPQPFPHLGVKTSNDWGVTGNVHLPQVPGCWGELEGSALSIRAAVA